MSMLFTDVYVYIIPTYHRNSSTSLLVFLLPLLLWLPQCLAFICCMYFSVPHTHTKAGKGKVNHSKRGKMKIMLSLALSL